MKRNYIRPLRTWLRPTAGRSAPSVGHLAARELEQIVVPIRLQRFGICFSLRMRVPGMLDLALREALAWFGNRRLGIHGITGHWRAPGEWSNQRGRDGVNDAREIC